MRRSAAIYAAEQVTIDLEPGALLAQRFVLSHPLGEGGMGVVWAAHDQAAKHDVALKLLHASLVGDDDLRRRFLAEARVASAIDHPAIVPVLELIELRDHTPVFVMELLYGETLARSIHRSAFLSVDLTVRLLAPVASALAAAHERGIVHRDLKPANIFIARRDDGVLEPKVLDFGIAKLLDPAHAGSIVTKAGTKLGTPGYMAPEQAAADQHIDCRADIWALGVVAYECLAGARPVEVTSIGHFLKRVITEAITPVEALAPDAPPELAQLIGRMLSPDRDERPADMTEIVASFERLAAG